MNGYDMMDFVRDEFCDDSALLSEIVSAMSERQAADFADWIARMNDISFDDMEE